MSAGDEEPPPSGGDGRKPARRRLARAGLGAGLAVLLALLVGLGVVVRYGVLTDAGRGLISAPLQGLSLGPLGRLHIEGLSGDVWRDFSLKRLTIADAEGVWLDARDVEVRWRPSALAGRRLHVESLTAAGVQVLRRPAVKASATGQGPSRPPLSIQLDSLRLRLQTFPAFSTRPGRFDIAANLDLDRSGGLGGAIQAKSLLHAGDGLDARFDLGLHHRLMLRARALEARGGAIAGSLGLPASQPFQLDADADGAAGDGRLSLSAFSGGKAFAEAAGVWGGGGGTVEARYALDASGLTAGLAHALGSQLRLSVVSRPSAGGLQALQARVAADNATASLAGPLDPKAVKTPQGFQLDLSVKDLTRVTATPQMGALTAAGRLSFNPKGWSWMGRAAVDRLSAYDYALARIDGPVEVDDISGELRIKADVQGGQGQGHGLLASAVGPHPRAVLDASRLSDGRLLLRSVKITGAGLELDAVGQRSLFGGLSFKGGAQIADIAALHPGAHG
ncbi:MAG: translocation/assembly module TamB, partial [Caulobacteraceae bacterium]|nr:translocation/assembly module TamB [Caulobacteraceae bacterium]